MPPKNTKSVSSPAPVFTLSSEQLDALADKVINRIDERLSARETYVDNRLDELQEENISLRAKTDDLEQRSRLENLRIFGIPEKAGENTDNLVIDVATKLQVPITTASIGRSHRVGPKKPGSTRAIIVKFVSFAERQKLFAAKKKLKGSGITIKEDLTNIRQSILQKALKQFTNQSIWTQNGVIVIKLDNVYHRIQTMKELDDLTTLEEDEEGNSL